MLDVGQRQLLVLLFMAQAEDNAPGYFGIDRVLKQLFHFLIDMGAECRNLIERWPRKGRPQLFLGNVFTEGNIVAVEEAMKLFAEWFVPGEV
jgi:hypothetical protein